MKVVVFGASGEIGRRLVDVLKGRGVQVVAAQRSTGADAYAGTGLEQACRGADVVVDCTNVTTTKAKVAVDFFGTVAGHIADAATAQHVPRVICLSIINAAHPEVNAKFGYYQGKAAQEQVYQQRLAPGVLTVVRSAQWYELAEQMMSGNRLGPVAAVPHMATRPLAAADAAQLLAEEVCDPAGDDVELAGPAQMDIVDVARALARRGDGPRWVIGINFGGPAIREGGLLPSGAFRAGTTSLDQWLATRS